MKVGRGGRRASFEIGEIRCLVGFRSRGACLGVREERLCWVGRVDYDGMKKSESRVLTHFERVIDPR
jgi:hypothetical protein